MWLDLSKGVISKSLWIYDTDNRYESLLSERNVEGYPRSSTSLECFLFDHLRQHLPIDLILFLQPRTGLQPPAEKPSAPILALSKLWLIGYFPTQKC